MARLGRGRKKVAMQWHSATWPVGRAERASSWRVEAMRAKFAVRG
jgi:hypothetical protein